MAVARSAIAARAARAHLRRQRRKQHRRLHRADGGEEGREARQRVLDHGFRVPSAPLRGGRWPAACQQLPCEAANALTSWNKFVVLGSSLNYHWPSRYRVLWGARSRSGGDDDGHIRAFRSAQRIQPDDGGDPLPPARSSGPAAKLHLAGLRPAPALSQAQGLSRFLDGHGSTASCSRSRSPTSKLLAPAEVRLVGSEFKVH